MPTGYTHQIKDGITFQQFALGCARAFGALITMRDDPSDAPIPDKFEPSDYHAKAIADAQAKLSLIQSMPEQQCENEAVKEYLDACERNQVRRWEYTDLRNKYNAMLAEAVKWEPPTTEHIKLKEFMLQQIRESIDFDCNESYITDPEKLSGSEWRTEQLAHLNKSVAHHTEENRKEIDRATSRTEWVSALRASL